MKKYSLTTKIHEGDGGGRFVLFPYDVEKEFGTKGSVPIGATIDGAFYGLVPDQPAKSPPSKGWSYPNSVIMLNSCPR